MEYVVERKTPDCATASTESMGRERILAVSLLLLTAEIAVEFHNGSVISRPFWKRL
jgi:hypothetical protein